MKKQIIILISCLAVVIISIGVYYFINKKQPQPGVVNNQATTPQVKTLNCFNITDANAKSACQSEADKILNSENSFACDALTGAADKENCRYTYVIKEAAQSGDLSKCEAMADKTLATNCLAQASFSLAIKKKEKKYCESIADKATKEDCLKVLVGMGIK